MLSLKNSTNLNDLFDLEPHSPPFYILKGDNKKETEIKIEHLQTIVNRKKQNTGRSTQMNYSASVTTNQGLTDRSSNSKNYYLNSAKKPKNLNDIYDIKEEEYNSDNDDEKSSYVKIQHGGGYTNN